MYQYIGEISGKKFKRYYMQMFFVVYALSQLVFNAL